MNISLMSLRPPQAPPPCQRPHHTKLRLSKSKAHLGGGRLVRLLQRAHHFEDELGFNAVSYLGDFIVYLQVQKVPNKAGEKIPGQTNFFNRLKAVFAMRNVHKYCFPCFLNYF